MAVISRMRLTVFKTLTHNIMKVDINTQKTPQFITWPLITGFSVPILVTLYKAFELWFF